MRRTIAIARAVVCGAIVTGGCSSAGSDEDLVDDICATANCDDQASEGDDGVLRFLVRTFVKTDFSAVAGALTDTIGDVLSALACPKHGVITHFVDHIEADPKRPWFTSVQDFTIDADIEPADVVFAFRDDWRRWWRFGTVEDGTLQSLPDGRFQIGIRPIGLPAVTIGMTVSEPAEIPEDRQRLDQGLLEFLSAGADLEPALVDPEQDPHSGAAWEWGVHIDMGRDPAFADGRGQKSFQGTMYILARRAEGRIHVREIWHQVVPTNDLVMSLPFSLQRRIGTSAFLHIVALQGCVPVIRGTGYPGLIDFFESGAHLE
jgi:hypothetical protein